MRPIVLVFASVLGASNAHFMAASPGITDRSLIECEQADPGIDQRLSVLIKTAEVALAQGDPEKVKTCGEDLLKMAAERCPAGWSGHSLHEGHRILGHVALGAGAVDAAKEHLMEAGRTYGSPALNSFGPKFTLANDLLARGEAEAVVEYLRLCSRFWKGHRRRIDVWIAEIQAGRRPELKRFGLRDPETSEREGAGLR